uniref:Uncharacterized protein n=1 Tax=Romanomermis culicivorax TaxID=13658 RepID=A0A915I2K7_ROMCU
MTVTPNNVGATNSANGQLTSAAAKAFYPTAAAAAAAAVAAARFTSSSGHALTKEAHPGNVL